VAEQYLARGDVDKAIAEYERGVAAMPSMGEAQVMLGTLYELRGKGDDAQKAQEAFSAAEATYRDSVEYLLTRARAYEAAGQLDRALGMANGALVPGS
jgi:lipopolysaccharide biosynthesis regulator YciM